MKSFILITLLLIIGCCSCSEKKESVFASMNNSQLDSVHFVIIQKEGYKTIHVFNDHFHQDTLLTYVLYHRGETKPTVNFSAVYVETPVERVACLSNIYVGCMARLGLTDRIVAVDEVKNICNNAVREGVVSGKVQELSRGENLNIEKVMLLRPDIIFRFGTGNEPVDFPALLKQSNIPVAISLDYREANPLSRASWLKFIAAFFEMDSVADSILNQVKKNYNSLKQKAENVSFRPSVITEVPFKDVWYVPGGKSYMACLLKDAGANYLWSADLHDGSLPLSFEAVFNKGFTAAFWLNVQYWKSLEDAANQDMRNSKFNAFQKENIFNNDLKNTADGAFAFWETGLIAPDDILADLIFIFHPELLPGHQFNYYRKLN